MSENAGRSLEAGRTILGAVLQDNGAWASVLEAELAAQDFGAAQCRGVFVAMAALAEHGTPIDPVTVRDELARTGQLEAVGGAAFVTGLMDGVPRITNLAAWCAIVKADARERHRAALVDRVAHKAAALRGPEADPAAFFAASHELEALPEAGIRGPAAARAYTLDDLARVTFPVRRALLRDGENAVLRQGQLVQGSAWRGTGKTWFFDSLAVALASGADLLRWRVPEPVRVCLIDGEMGARELTERLRERIMPALGVTSCPNLTIVAADWQDDPLPRLDTPEGQRFVEPHVAGADVVILDGRATLFHPGGEKDPEIWRDAQDWLLSLRRRGKAVLWTHQTGKNRDARGISAPEDVCNLTFSLSRPSDYRPAQGCRVSFEWTKARALYGTAADGFTASCTDGSWTLEGQPEALGPYDKLRRDILAAVVGKPDGCSRNYLEQTVKGSSTRAKRDTLAELVEAGEVRDVAGKLYLAGGR